MRVTCMIERIVIIAKERSVEKAQISLICFEKKVIEILNIRHDPACVGETSKARKLDILPHHDMQRSKGLETEASLSSSAVNEHWLSRNESYQYSSSPRLLCPTSLRFASMTHCK